MADWAAGRSAYEAGEPLRAVAIAAGVTSDNSVRKHIKAGGWVRKGAQARKPEGAQQGAQKVRKGKSAHPSKALVQVAAPPLEGEVQPPGNRDAAGHFLPGQSGNPSGRPASMPEITRLAREKTADVVQGLFEFATSKANPGAARVRAYEALAELGWGKVPAHFVIDDNREQPGGPDNGAGVIAELEVLFQGIIRAKAHDKARQEAVPADAQ